MNILITGGSGFIGSYLIKTLNKLELNIFLLTRGTNPIKKNYSNITFLNKSLEDLELNDFVGIEVVVHLAAKGVSPKKASIEEMNLINAKISLKLIKLALNAGVRRFISTGTCLEYGQEANKWPKIPPYASLKPLTPYAKSKAESFKLLNEFAYLNEIEFYYGRIFSAYGEGQYEKNFWPSLKVAADSGEDFHMTSGEQIRDFILVDDVANHLKCAVFRSDLKKGLPFVVNIGSGKGMKLKNFAESQWKKFNAKGKLIIGSTRSRPNEIKRMVANIEGLNTNLKES